MRAKKNPASPRTPWKLLSPSRRSAAIKLACTVHLNALALHGACGKTCRGGESAAKIIKMAVLERIRRREIVMKAGCVNNT